MTDIIIYGGLVYDGLGGPPINADIGIKDCFIEYIIPTAKAPPPNHAKEILDARGLCVSPGFIDAHGHSDFRLLGAPESESKILQGITTEVGGNCGLSGAPLYGEAKDRRADELSSLGIKQRWNTLKEYFTLLKQARPAINFATLTGHGNLRGSVIGYREGGAGPDELKKMKALLAESVNAGSLGLSTGLIYPPGVFSDTLELTELCKAINGHIYTTHMRSEGDGLLESVDEVTDIAANSGIKAHISHLKTGGEHNWHKIDSLLYKINNAREKQNLDITADRYPYTAGSTDLDAVLPAWVFQGGKHMELKRLRDKTLRRRISSEMASNGLMDLRSWSTVVISSVGSAKNHWMVGRSIAEVAEASGCGPLDAVYNILLEDELSTEAVFHSQSSDNMLRILKEPYVMVGSDSSTRNYISSDTQPRGAPHPRTFGTFPRFLAQCVRDEALMLLETAIRKCTSLTASTFGLNKRGALKAGHYADIVIFDYSTLGDNSTYESPWQKPTGLEHVIVNGTVAVRSAIPTGLRPGAVLRGGGE